MKLEEKSVVQVSLEELLDMADRIEEKLKKIEALADDALIKANISHSLIVVRKIAENKVQDLSELID